MKLQPEIASLIRMSYDPGDPWGSYMSHLFGTCEVLYWETDTAPPAECEFLPGVMRPSLEEWPDCEYLDMLRDGYIEPADLYHAATVLNRLADYMQSKGLDY